MPHLLESRAASIASEVGQVYVSGRHHYQSGYSVGHKVKTILSSDPDGATSVIGHGMVPSGICPVAMQPCSQPVEKWR